jgi:hypothetical protein
VSVIVLFEVPVKRHKLQKCQYAKKVWAVASNYVRKAGGLLSITDNGFLVHPVTAIDEILSRQWLEKRG